MASTSLFGKSIEYEPAEHAANEAIDTLQARVIANNLAHLADAGSQVIKACPPFASGEGWSHTYPASGTLWGLHATFGPFFPRLRTNGRPNAIRYRIHCRTATASNSVEFGVWLHPANTNPAGFPTAATAFAAGNDDSVQIHTATSTTPDWVAPDSGDPLLRMTRAQVQAAYRTFGVRDEIGGADLSIFTPHLAISVFSRRASGSTATSAELTGFYAAEVYA